MASLYRDKTHGHQIIFLIHLPTGETLKRYRYASDKEGATILWREADRIETATRRADYTDTDIIRAINFKLLTPEDAAKFTDLGKTQPVTLRDIEPLYEDYARKHWNNRTQRSYLCATKIIITALGDIAINEGFADTVEQYLSGLDRSPRTRNIYLDRIRQMIDIAVSRKRLISNPLNDIRKYRDEAVRFPRALTYEEVAWVLDESRQREGIGGQYLECSLILLFCGLRLSELKYLTWEDIGTDRIIIQPKAIAADETEERLKGGQWSPKRGSSRAVTINDKVWQKKIIGHIRKLKRQGRFVFGGKSSINRFTIDSAYNDRLLKKQPFSLHSLRHTFITWRISSGDPLPQVMYLAGHRNIETTMRYTHIAEKKMANIMKLL